MFFTRSSRGLSTPASSQLLIHCSGTKEQAEFRRGKSTADQVVFLTQNIEDSFEAKKKAGIVFFNLKAAYDTVWHHGLTCKLLRLLPDKHMVKIIMQVVRNRCFTLITGDSKQSRLSCLKNSVFQRSVLATFVFNIYLSQTLFGNPKGPVELGNPNTCAETKLCLNFILFRLKKSAMNLKLLYSWFERKLGLVR